MPTKWKIITQITVYTDNRPLNSMPIGSTIHTFHVSAGIVWNIQISMVLNCELTKLKSSCTWTSSEKSEKMIQNACLFHVKSNKNKIIFLFSFAQLSAVIFIFINFTAVFNRINHGRHRKILKSLTLEPRNRKEKEAKTFQYWPHFNNNFFSVFPREIPEQKHRMMVA